MEEVTAQSAEPIVMEQKETEAPAPVKEKVKIDGQEMEVTLDELKSTYQKGRSADKRFQEAADLRKQVESFLEHAKSNPKELLSQLGIEPKEWAQQLLLAELEAEELEQNPDKKRMAELEKRLAKFEERDAEVIKAKEEAARIAEEEKLVASLDSEITKHIEELGLLKNGAAPAELLLDITEQMLIEHKATQKHLSPKDAFSRVKESFAQRVQALTKYNPDALVELLPQDYLDKVAESYIAKRKSKEVPSIAANKTPAKVDVKKDKIDQSLRDFFASKGF